MFSKKKYFFFFLKIRLFNKQNDSLKFGQTTLNRSFLFVFCSFLKKRSFFHFSERSILFVHFSFFFSEIICFNSLIVFKIIYFSLCVLHTAMDRAVMIFRFKKLKDLITVVGDYINIMKTTFELNFNFYQAFKQQGYTKVWKQWEALNLKSFTLITCKLVIRKKLVNN